MKNRMKIIALSAAVSFILISLLSINTLTGQSGKSSHKHEQVQDMVKSELIRTGTIDLQSIDINKDKKVFECPMDWNVLADDSANCPVCGMYLEEYSLDSVKTNLIKHDFKVK